MKEDHRYVTKAAYVVLGITMDGRKDILGVWIGEHPHQKPACPLYIFSQTLFARP